MRFYIEKLETFSVIMPILNKINYFDCILKKKKYILSPLPLLAKTLLLIKISPYLYNQIFFSIDTKTKKRSFIYKNVNAEYIY